MGYSRPRRRLFISYNSCGWAGTADVGGQQIISSFDMAATACWTDGFDQCPEYVCCSAPLGNAASQLQRHHCQCPHSSPPAAVSPLHTVGRLPDFAHYTVSNEYGRMNGRTVVCGISVIYFDIRFYERISINWCLFNIPSTSVEHWYQNLTSDFSV